MKFRGKSLYNLLRMNPDNQDLPSWQIEDYRTLSDKMLFNRLEEVNVFLNTKSLPFYVEECASPEELTELLSTEEEYQGQIYLLLFELWRRNFKEKQSLSIFCDELDYVINQYDQNPLENDEAIQMQISALEGILDESVDEGENPMECFTYLSSYCSHDIESFMYDYISTQIDNNNPLLASEFIDGFADYFENKELIQFLHTRLMIETDSEEALYMIDHLLERLEEKPDLELFFDLLQFLVQHGKHDQFLKAFRLTLPHLQSDDDIRRLLQVARDYFRFLDKEEEEGKVTSASSTEEVLELLSALTLK